MRTTLLGGLLDAARRNLAHGSERASLFESGRAFLGRAAAARGPGPRPGPSPATCPRPTASPTAWRRSPSARSARPAWRGETPAADFFVAQGRDRGARPRHRRRARVRARESEPFLHPARAASVSFGGVDAGWLGELHPAVAAEWDLPSAVAFEFDVAPLLDARRPATRSTRTS